jgi:putative transposase
MAGINNYMQQLKAHKFRIYPTTEEANQLANFFGAKRWLFNHYLAEQKDRFFKKEKHLSNFDINKLITQLKKETDTTWLREIDDWCLKHAAEDLTNAYQQFFDSIKGKRRGKKQELPKFKSKYNKQTYRTRGIKLTDKGLKLPKIKTHININLHQEIIGNIKSATISKTPSGKYFVSILCETDIEILPMAGKEVGIDMGLKDLLILSNGIKFTRPEQIIGKAKLLLKKQQKKLSRKTKGSKNHELLRLQVAKLYERITLIRNDYYHNISTYLVKNYDAIYVEDLNVSGMMKNRKLSRAIAEASWSTLSNMIEYKCAWYGKTYYRINRWFASSKTCSSCGHKLDQLSLSTREWICPSCGSTHDRDINAAVNIKNIGQIDLYNKKISDAIADMGYENIPTALQKMASKIERSGSISPVSYRSGQAARDL